MSSLERNNGGVQGALALADITKRTELEWAEIIAADLGRAVEGIIAAGEHLHQAKYQLGYGRFLPLLKSLGLHQRTAERLMKIATNRVLTNPTHGSRLPASMRTLYELSTLPANLLEAKIVDGTITPEIERKDVEALKKDTVQRSTVDGESATERPLSRLELGQENTALKAENASLLKAQGGEHLFDPKNSTDHEIAVAMIGRLGGWRGRARRIAKLMLDILDERAEPKRGGATR